MEPFYYSAFPLLLLENKEFTDDIIRNNHHNLRNQLHQNSIPEQSIDENKNFIMTKK